MRQSSLYQYMLLAIASLSPINTGMHFGWTSVSLPQLFQNDSHIPITSDQGYWIAANVFTGNLVACFASPFIINVTGEKDAFFCATLLLLIPWLIIAYASTLFELLTARFLFGVGEAFMLCALPPYFAEISEASLRGFMVSSIMVSSIAGILLIHILGMYANMQSAALISASLPLLVLAFYPIMPETPRRLVSNGDHDSAKAILQKLRNTTNVDDELKLISSTVLSSTPTNFNSCKNLFKEKNNRKALCICLILISVGICSGDVPFTFYTQQIFEEAGGSISSSVSSIIFLTIQVIFSAFSCVVVDKVGRRPLLMLSTLGVAIILFSEFVYFYVKDVMKMNTSSFGFIPLSGLVIFVIVFNLGLQTIPSILCVELVTSDVKIFALSLYEAYYDVLGIVVLKIFQFTNDTFGIRVPFLLFALSSFLGFVFIYYFVPETKQRTLEQIQSDLRGETDLDVKVCKNY